MEIQFRNHPVLPHFSRGPPPRGLLSGFEIDAGIRYYPDGLISQFA